MEGQAVIDPAVQHHLLNAISTIPATPNALSKAAQLPGKLTAREAEGEIAEHLTVSEGTVKSHVNRLLAKTGCHGRARPSSTPTGTASPVSSRAPPRDAQPG
jgi:DNA-binding NarL/FixJ family response regulator